ncbi:glycosyltransferase family 4 protein [Luteolibacter sp. LG18]|uniref:glycosyltransferase family 4 protein n=1 Tax=Luteolibacter sp. LG18 TaxID=2819286 RepID=UPI002B2BA007|nr:glycosyl transferase family 1 [Luteolibacter sp. LG18]
MILPYVPWPLRRGTYQRVYHLAEQIGRQYGMDLFCLSSEEEDASHLPRFGNFCTRVEFVPFEHPPWAPFWTKRLWDPVPVTVSHWWSERVLEALRGFTCGKEYDFIWFCDLVMWPYVREVFPDHPARIMDRSRVDWLFQTEELNTLDLSFLERLKRKENLSKITRLEREVWDELALTVVCGPDDKTFLVEKGGPAGRIEVLANGANVAYFNADEWPPAPTGPPSALFCGALDYTPNTDGLAWYFEHIHGLVLREVPDFRVILVGKSPIPRVVEYGSLPGVEFVGEVPDVRPFYQKAWLQMVPLRIGGGTRLKIAEGLAMANPVVSTTLGAQGLNLVHERELLLGDTPEAFAAAIVRYLRDPELRQRHGRAGRDTILSTYTWEALGRSIGRRIDSLASPALP